MTSFSGVQPSDIRDAAFGFTIPDGSGIDVALDRLIQKAGLLLSSKIGNLAARVAAGEIDKITVAAVVEDMVLRVVANPEGKKSERIDDYAYSLDDRVAAGFLFVTDDEISRILPGSQRARAFGNIRLSVPTWRLPR